MSDRWDHYLGKADGVPSSIFVDLGISYEAPVPSRSLSLRITVGLTIERPDGLSHEDEAEPLFALEDDLRRVLAETADAVYVGRVTGGGQRQFFYYAHGKAGLPKALPLLEARHPNYPLRVDAMEDPGWRVYFEFLYPDRLGRQFILDTHTRRALEEQGDPLITTREVDHYAVFADEEAARGFGHRAVGDLALLLRGVTRTEKGGWSVDLVGRHPVDGPTLEPITGRLVRLAEEFCGDYGGWGCMVQKPG